MSSKTENVIAETKHENNETCKRSTENDESMDQQTLKTDDEEDQHGAGSLDVGDISEGSDPLY
ncbi:uncharacterized protein BYT42DRAFT_617882 [Radiomyces spectabilis]|uniref:uncharacterized protein n=1 Tax=Radiomyces spectabilis TaxID=64574 RepID=UPI00221E5991|nr:uncharacterized protein BYT42DRAFT_617882 [Radiomyces spectabilis]KAI8367450.1 hypothetical protein BYT42DRAFT_617882 [Radiomyces spectabilis]